MIHSARPAVSPVANIVFALFCFARFEKWGRTDDMCENNDPTCRDCGSAERINNWRNSKLILNQLRGPEFSPYIDKSIEKNNGQCCYLILVQKKIGIRKKENNSFLKFCGEGLLLFWTLVLH